MRPYKANTETFERCGVRDAESGAKPIVSPMRLPSDVPSTPNDNSQAPSRVLSEGGETRATTDRRGRLRRSTTNEKRSSHPVRGEVSLSLAADPHQFCDDMWGPLVGTLTVKLGRRDVAEELAQEALGRAWERWPEVSVMKSPDRWVFRVALNLASSRIRRFDAERRAKKRLERFAHDRAALDHALAAGAAGETTVDILELRQAMASLTERQRLVVGLRFYGDRSVADVADICGIAEGTVKATTSQAMERLRTLLFTDDETAT